MAKLEAMPEQAIVDGYKGHLDYYYWKGIPCVRMWPTWKRRQAWPDEQANQDAFSYAVRMWPFLPEYIQLQYNKMAVSTNVVGRDIYMRGYLNAGRPK